MVPPPGSTHFAMIIPDLSTRFDAPERMDAPDCCEEKLARTISQFRFINRLYSRYGTLLRRHVLADMLRDPRRAYHLVDLAAGGGDIAAWLLATADEVGLQLRVTAIDSDPRIVGFAERQYGRRPGLEIRCMNAFDLEQLEPVDYLFSNHFLHHLGEEDIVRMLELAARSVRRLSLFSDLRRSYVSYCGFMLTAGPLFRRSFALEDGLISIRKGFTADELKTRAEQAGLTDRARVDRLFPGRLVLAIGR